MIIFNPIKICLFSRLASLADLGTTFCQSCIDHLPSAVHHFSELSSFSAFFYTLFWECQWILLDTTLVMFLDHWYVHIPILPQSSLFFKAFVNFRFYGGVSCPKWCKVFDRLSNVHLLFETKIVTRFTGSKFFDLSCVLKITYCCVIMGMNYLLLW